MSAPPQPHEILWWSDIIIISIFSHLKGNKTFQIILFTSIYLTWIIFLIWEMKLHAENLLFGLLWNNMCSHTQIPAQIEYRIPSLSLLGGLIKLLFHYYSSIQVILITLNCLEKGSPNLCNEELIFISLNYGNLSRPVCGEKRGYELHMDWLSIWAHFLRNMW